MAPWSNRSSISSAPINAPLICKLKTRYEKDNAATLPMCDPKRNLKIIKTAFFAPWTVQKRSIR